MCRHIMDWQSHCWQRQQQQQPHCILQGGAAPLRLSSRLKTGLVQAIIARQPVTPRPLVSVCVFLISAEDLLSAAQLLMRGDLTDAPM